MGVHRNSTFGGLGGSEKLKDTRPLHDKSFVQQCIRKLCEVLYKLAISNSLNVVFV